MTDKIDQILEHVAVLRCRSDHMEKWIEKAETRLDNVEDETKKIKHYTAAFALMGTIISSVFTFLYNNVK